jgi:hypothetical protein
MMTRLGISGSRPLRDIVRTVPNREMTVAATDTMNTFTARTTPR